LQLTKVVGAHFHDSGVSPGTISRIWTFQPDPTYKRATKEAASSFLLKELLNVLLRDQSAPFEQRCTYLLAAHNLGDAMQFRQLVPRGVKSGKSEPVAELRLRLRHPAEEGRQRSSFIPDYDDLKPVWKALPEADAAILQPNESGDATVTLAYDHLLCSSQPIFGVIVLQKNVAVSVTAAQARRGSTIHPIPYKSASALRQDLSLTEESPLHLIWCVPKSELRNGNTSRS